MARSERIARSVLSASAPRADVAQAASGFRSTQLALVCGGRFSGSTSIAQPPGPWNTARRLARDNNSYHAPTGRLTMGSSLYGTPFDRRSLTASATRWPANGSGSMGSLRARARPCRRAVGAGPAGRAKGCGRRGMPGVVAGTRRAPVARPRGALCGAVGRGGACGGTCGARPRRPGARRAGAGPGADRRNPRQQHRADQRRRSHVESRAAAHSVHNNSRREATRAGTRLQR